MTVVILLHQTFSLLKLLKNGIVHQLSRLALKNQRWSTPTSVFVIYVLVLYHKAERVMKDPAGSTNVRPRYFPVM